MLSKRKKVGSDVAAKMEGELVKVRNERMEETVRVAWNHFEETAVGAFKLLQEDTHFTDVTLACGDGQVLFSTLFNFFQHSLRLKPTRPFLAAAATFSSKFLSRTLILTPSSTSPRRM